MKKKEQNNVSAKQVNNVYNATSEANEVTNIATLEAEAQAESEASNEASEAEAVGTTSEVNAVNVGTSHTPRTGRFKGRTLICVSRKRIANGKKYINVWEFQDAETSELVTTTPNGQKTTFTSPEVCRQILGIEPKDYDRNGSRSVLTLEVVPRIVRQVQAKQAKLQEVVKQLVDLCELYGFEAEASEAEITEAVTAYITNKQLQAAAEAEAKRKEALKKQLSEANEKQRKQSKIATMQRAIDDVKTALLFTQDIEQIVTMLLNKQLVTDEAEARIIIKHCTTASEAK